MRALFLLLLMLNLAYFGWKFQLEEMVGVSPSERVMPMPKDVAPLVLLSERPGASNKTSPDDQPPAEPAVPAAVRQCYEFGPFARLEDATAAETVLVNRGIAAGQRLIERREQTGYWVYLPSLPSLREAQEKLKELQQQGLKDLFLIGRGDQRNAISLGLFEKLNSAKSRMDELKNLGHQPEMEIQYETRPEYVVDAEVAGDQPPLSEALAGYAGLNYVAVDCR